MLRHLNRFTFAAFIIGFLLCYTAMLLTGGGHTDEAIWDVTCYNDLVGYSQAGITELLGKPDDKLVVFGATPPPELSPESLLVWKNSSYQYGLIYGNIELRFNQFDRVFQVSPVKWSDGRVAPLLNKMNPHASQ